jgi:hypothetical protein
MDMKKVYLIEHSICEAFKSDLFHEVEKVFDSEEKAYRFRDGIIDGVNNMTSKYFKDKEYGWITPKLWDNCPYEFGCWILSYEWKTPGTDISYFSKWIIREKEVE